MKLGTLLVLLALVTAPACGGGGGGTDSGTGGSGGPLSASFIPDQPSPAASTVAMAQGTKSSDVVTVNVTLTDTNNTLGVAFDVVFDDANAVYLGFVKGTAYEQGGNVPNYTVDGTTQAGRVVVAVARTNGTTTNVAGTKTAVGLQFRVKNPGTFPVTFQNGAVYDGQLTPQPLPGISWFAGALKGV